jgi:hypothetical protein
MFSDESGRLTNVPTVETIQAALREREIRKGEKGKDQFDLKGNI